MMTSEMEGPARPRRGRQPALGRVYSLAPHTALGRVRTFNMWDDLTLSLFAEYPVDH
jgi:hypothetical protein